MIRHQIPISKKASKKRKTILTSVPYKVAFILSTLLPMASKLKESGAWIYWSKQNGANAIIYLLPSWVLYIRFKKNVGNNIKQIVEGIPIIIEKDIAWGIFLFVSLILFL